jgi:tRNA pseudouridine55 synthase
MNDSRQNTDSAINGFLVIDKPEGITSHDVVAAVRRCLSVRKAGHLGTLDPMATGVLPVAVGKATRLVRFLGGGRKVYQGIIQLGLSTNTYDREGEPSSERQQPTHTAAQLEVVRKEMMGEQMQAPPPFSAVKVGGVRAYRMARRGEALNLEPRSIHIYQFELREMAEHQLGFEIHCSPGTYIRSIAYDVGRKLGCGAHLFSLRRTASGEFSLSQAFKLESLTGQSRQDLLKCVLPMEAVLRDLVSVRVSAEEQKSFVHGQTITASINLPCAQPPRLIRICSISGELLGLADVLDVLATGTPLSVARLQPRVVLA